MTESACIAVFVVVDEEEEKRIQRTIDSTMCSKRYRFDDTSLLMDEPTMI
jgi:hypothetical protein